MKGVFLDWAAESGNDHVTCVRHGNAHGRRPKGLR